MLELARFEGRRRLKGSLALAVGLAAFGGLYVGFYPTLAASEGLQEYVESLPPALREAFGIRSFATIEGYLATELYSALWTLLFGLYLAYSGASLVAGDVEHRRVDVTLSLPVSRARYVVEKYLTLLVPITVANLVVAPATYVGTVLIDDPAAPERLVAAHLLSVPYLLTCAAFGLLLSVATSRESVAQRAALGGLFGLFVLDSVVSTTEFEAVGAVAPMRHFDPAAILIDGQYDLVAAGVLLAGTVGLVAVAVVWFRRRDV